MNRKPTPAAAVLIAIAALAGCNQQPAVAPIVGTNVATGFVSGNHTYDTVCGQCHETGVGPMLRGRQLHPQLFTQIVRNGMAAMPAFPASAITDAELNDVAQLIQSSATPQTEEPANGN